MEDGKCEMVDGKWKMENACRRQGREDGKRQTIK